MDSLTEINNDTRFEHFIDESLDIDMSACTPIRGSGNTSYIDEILGTAATTHSASGIVSSTTSTVKPISPASAVGTQTHEFLVRLSPVARKLSPPKQPDPLVVSTPNGTAMPTNMPMKTVRLFGQEQQTGNASIAASNALTAVTIKTEIFATGDQEEGSHDFLVPSGRTTALRMPVSSSPTATKPTGALVAAKKSLPIDFFCHQCDVRIKLHVEFENHYRTAHDTVPPIYACQQCPAKQFGNLQSYRTHVKRHSERYPCAVCTRKFLSAELLAEHGRTHTSELRLQCGHCQQQFDDFGVYCQHVRVHRRPPAAKPVKWKCPDCGKLFKNRAGLNNHAKVHRDGAAKTTAALVVGTVDAVASTSDAIIAIPVPPAPTPAAPRAVTIRSVALQLPQAPSALARNVTDKPQSSVAQPVAAAVAAHKPQPTAVIANADRPFACDVCHKTFPGRTQLLRHRDHHNERSFKCLTCSKFYKTERDLKVHSLVHYEQRPHACTHCGKSFLSSSKLKQHSNVHTGERPFKCKYCDKDFTNFPNWLKHVRRSHKVDHKTGEQLEQLPNFLVREKKGAGGAVRVKKEPKEATADVRTAATAAFVAAKPKPAPRKTKAQQQAAAAAAAAASQQQQHVQPAVEPKLPLIHQPMLAIVKQEFIVPDESDIDLHDTNATTATPHSHLYQDEASLPLDLRDLSASIQLQQSIDVHDMQQMQLLIPSHDESFASIEDARDVMMVRKSVSPATAAAAAAASVVGKVMLGKVAGGAQTTILASTSTPKLIKVVEPGRFSFARRPDAESASSTTSPVSFLTLLNQSTTASSDTAAAQPTSTTTTVNLTTSGQSAAPAGGVGSAANKSSKQLSPLANVPRRHFGGVASHSHHMFATNVL